MAGTGAGVAAIDLMLGSKPADRSTRQGAPLALCHPVLPVPDDKHASHDSDSNIHSLVNRVARAAREQSPALLLRRGRRRVRTWSSARSTRGRAGSRASGRHGWSAGRGRGWAVLGSGGGGAVLGRRRGGTGVSDGLLDDFGLCDIGLGHLLARGAGYGRAGGTARQGSTSCGAGTAASGAGGAGLCGGGRRGVGGGRARAYSTTSVGLEEAVLSVSLGEMGM